MCDITFNAQQFRGRRNAILGLVQTVADCLALVCEVSLCLRSLYVFEVALQRWVVKVFPADS